MSTMGQAGSRANQLSRLARGARPGICGSALGAPLKLVRPFWRARSGAVVTIGSSLPLRGTWAPLRTLQPASSLSPRCAELGALWREYDPGGAGLERHREIVVVEVVGELVQVRLGPGAGRGRAAAARAAGEHVDAALAVHMGARHRGTGAVAHHRLLVRDHLHDHIGDTDLGPAPGQRPHAGLGVIGPRLGAVAGNGHLRGSGPGQVRGGQHVALWALATEVEDLRRRAVAADRPL